MPNTLSNKRIVKNTFYLYIRMGITLLVQLYTSRVVLNVLGVNDFGLWSVIASLVVSFSFFSGPLTTATQRFLNFEIGSGGGELRKIFNTSLLLFIAIAILLFFVLESVGVWFLNVHMNIAPERLPAANWVFQFSIFSFIVTFLRMPYESAIIAEEKMSFYAVICILEAVLLLVIVYVLLIPKEIDKLIVYGILTFISKLVVSLCYKFYCNKNIKYTAFRLIYDKGRIKELASFSGWNLFGAVASASATQGVNVLLNMFFGVAVNAAYGIASQVGVGVKSFITNFQKAANPQLVKSYASSEIIHMQSLLCGIGKYSYFLLLALAFPAIMNMDWILHFWLGNVVPLNTALFCDLMLLQMLIVCLGDPIDTAVFATGKIRNYQIVLGFLVTLNIVFSYCLFKMGFPPISTLIVKCIVEIFILAARLWFVHIKIALPLRVYLLKTIVPIVCVTLIIVMIMLWIFDWFSFGNGWKGMVSNCLLFYMLYFPCIWFVGLRSSERKKVSLMVKNKIHKKHANQKI